VPEWVFGIKFVLWLVLQDPLFYYNSVLNFKSHKKSYGKEIILTFFRIFAAKTNVTNEKVLDRVGSQK